MKLQSCDHFDQIVSAMNLYQRIDANYPTVSLYVYKTCQMNAVALNCDISPSKMSLLFLRQQLEVA